MPTDKQHFDMEVTNHELFGGNPEIVGYAEEINHTRNNIGKTIGTIEFDTKSKELIMTLQNEDKE